jgi:hypothetical protein
MQAEHLAWLSAMPDKTSSSARQLGQKMMWALGSMAFLIGGIGDWGFF